MRSLAERRAFGGTGASEKVIGLANFAVDPANPHKASPGAAG